MSTFRLVGVHKVRYSHYIRLKYPIIQKLRKELEFQIPLWQKMEACHDEGSDALAECPQLFWLLKGRAMIIAAIRWLTIIMFCWNWIYWSMNHSAQVNLIAPHTVDGKDSGGAFRGSHYSTHRHTHVRCKCAPAHTPFTLPGVPPGLWQQLDCQERIITWLTVFSSASSPILALRFPGVSVSDHRPSRSQSPEAADLHFGTLFAHLRPLPLISEP